MVKAFEEASGRPIPYEIVDRRPGDVSSSYCTPTLAEKELGWKANLNLLDMCMYQYLWKLSWEWEKPQICTRSNFLFI